MSITVAELADQLRVAEGDVRVLLEALGEPPAEHLDAEVAAGVRRMLSPNGERTAPDALYWPHADPEVPLERGTGAAFPSPTREPRYPPL